MSAAPLLPLPEPSEPEKHLAAVDRLVSKFKSPAEAEAFVKSLTENQARWLPYEWRHFWARPNQVAPPDPDWRVWLVNAGRGFGKTRTGAEWVREQVEAGRSPGMLVGQTPEDVRDVMVEGPAGLMSVFPPWQRPHYEPSKKRITFHTGVVANIRSGADPDSLRGPAFAWGWLDELAAFMYAKDVWDNFQFGLRIGLARACVTTTPRPIKIISGIRDDPHTRISGGSTYENYRNLPPSTLEYFRQKYEGTTLGQQELHAAFLEELPGALWSRKLLDETRVPEPPQDKVVPVGPYSRRLTFSKGLKRIVVAVDPAVSSEETSNLTGIIVCGMDNRKPAHGYVLADLSGRFTPEQWAQVVIKAYRDWKADRVIGEANNGGDLVERNLRAMNSTLPYKKVHATRGKYKRAEPVAGLYEQGRCHHVGFFADLEDQQRTWLPDDTKASPDRLDALVWGMTELLVGENYTIGGFPVNI